MPIPSVNRTPLQIVTAADKNYLPYLACHLASLGKNGSKSITMEITIIHRGISRHIQLDLEKLISHPHRISWFEPKEELLQKIKAPDGFNTCSPHYFRLLIPFVLPECPKALYLDADTLVLDDLLPLWNTDLEGHAVAAVRDYIPRICEAVANWKELHLDPNAPYFNSGVLLIDLTNWRAEKVPQRVLDICQEYKDKLLAQQKWPQYDQYGLNVVLHKRWKEINQAWNYGTDLPPSKAKIIHYIGNGKVGLPTCHSFFSSVFFDILYHTSYRNWLPQGAVNRPITSLNNLP